MRVVWFWQGRGGVCMLLGVGGLLWGSTWWGYGIGLGAVFIVAAAGAMGLEMRTWKHTEWFWD